VLIVLASKSVIDFEFGSIDLKCRLRALRLAADHLQGEEAVDPEVQIQAPLPEKAKARWLNSWKC